MDTAKAKRYAARLDKARDLRERRAWWMKLSPQHQAQHGWEYRSWSDLTAWCLYCTPDWRPPKQNGAWR